MNKNRLYFRYAVFTAIIVMLFGMSAGSYAQGAANELIKSLKTKNGSITYIEFPVGELDINLFSKVAGEPSDFAGVVQRCAGNKQQVVFAMNGGKCDKSLTPLGLLIKELAKYKDFVAADKNVFGPIDPSGVFAVDRGNGVHIIPSKNFKASSDLATYKLAIQSGAMLMSRGFLNPNITRVTNAQISNGIGIKANGDIVFAVCDSKMSLHEFALAFQELNCKDAMYLDEGDGCQWYAPGGLKKVGRMGEVLVVTKK